MRIGFIGLGNMGRPMCRRLANAGSDLVLFDVNERALADTAAEHRALAATSPAHLASTAEAIVLSLPGEAEVASVMFGPGGITGGAPANLLVLDATTLPVAATRSFATRAATHGIDYLDTPVSIIRPVGGEPSMTFMAGGSPEAFARALPVLRCIGTNVRRVGPTGSGGEAKLLNQAIYVSYMTAFAEALMLGERLGLAREALLDVLGTSAAGVPNIVAKYDEILGRSNQRFPIDNALHYLELVDQMAEGTGAAMPVVAAVAASLRTASRAGIGREDVIAGRLTSRD